MKATADYLHSGLLKSEPDVCLPVNNQACLGLVQVVRDTWLEDLACVFTGHQAELSLSTMKSHYQIHCHT